MKNNLERIFVMRNIGIAGQVIVIFFVHRVLGIELPLVPMASAVLLLAIANFGTRLRLRHEFPVTEAELFFQLLIDVSILTFQLYLSGGSTNPFVSLYLIPLIISAATLSRIFTWVMAALTISCYTLLMSYFEPLHQQTFKLHIFAMWMTFVFSTMLIAFFVVRMGESIRERDRLLARAREDSLRDERIVALGTLAAGAAHELGTPLATMSLLCEEMEAMHSQQEDLAEDLAMLSAQIENCKRIITGLLASAGEARSEGGRLVRADMFMEKVIGQWTLMRPAAIHHYRRQDGEIPSIFAEQTLSQAILNLLNNAADASPECVEVDLGWGEDEIRIEIRDRGAGLTPEAAEKAGSLYFSTKPEGKGLGIGLFLANASIERLGGSIRIFNRMEGGAVTLVTLPTAS